MKNTFIQRALDVAKESEYYIRIGCIITNKRGRVVSQGVNKLKTHPKQAFFAKKHGIKEKIFLHAEMAALVRCREEPHTMYIGRLMKDGTAGMCKPCPICEAAIREAGVQLVIYTDEFGKEITYKIEK